MFWWIKANWELMYRLLTLIGVFASLAALVISLGPSLKDFGFGKSALVFFSLAFFVLAFFLELRSAFRKKSIPVADKKRIRDFMFKWISSGERVAIFSRDLSWVDDEKIKELLFSKASAGELCICVPRETDLTRELRHVGAEIYTYSHIDHVPQSRFTIVNFGRGGSRVAVGNRHGNFHVIEEFSANDHPAFYMANDLVMLVKKYVEAASALLDK